jgi:hypothetical protein
MFSFSAIAPAVAVVVDSQTGRPREIRADGARLPITAMEAVRDETAAYPLGSGPRTVFVVRSGLRRYRLVHLLGERRWTVEELASTTTGLTRAA